MFGLERWNPNRTMNHPEWAQFENLMSDFFEEPFLNGTAQWAPSSDVMETDNEIRIHIDLPGMKKNQLDIQLAGDNALVIKGERKFEEREDSKYTRRERYHGIFARTFLLPTNIERDKITASFQEGVLEIVLPKAESAKARRIEVKG